MQDSSLGLAESSSVGTSSSSSTSGGVDTGEIDCSTFATQDACEAAGCNVEHGEAFAWDSATGVCSSLGPTIVCHATGVLTAPGDYWREVDGVVEVVQLNNMPFDLDGWERCGCVPGDPFGCFGCGSSGSCNAQECDRATDAEACAALDASIGCAWVETTVYAADGVGCAVVESAGKCITGLPGKASCELVEAPQSCAAWTSESPPYVRSVDGGIELVDWASCDAWPMGYMPCWSAGVGDPAACDCAC